MDQTLEIYVFSVGFGDCIHVAASTGTQFLIDTGLVQSYARITNQLIDLGKRIDYIILTHDHSDHIAGMSKLLDDNRFEIKGVLLWLGTDTVKSITNLVKWQKINDIQQNIHLPVMSITNDNVHKLLQQHGILVLHPTGFSNYNSANLNKNSIVLAVKLKEHTFLMMGDATLDEERLILQTASKLKNTCFIKLGHHGSDTSSDKQFMNALVSDEKDLLAACSCKSNWDTEPPNSSTIRDIRDLIGTDKLICTGENGKHYDIRIEAIAKDNEDIVLKLTPTEVRL